MTKGEILSQSQIDALLSALESGETSAEELKTQETDTGKVSKYDFKHPSKFSREHIQTLIAIHEAFGRLFATHLTAQFRLPVQITVVSVDQLTYDEFMKALGTPTVIITFTMEPLKGYSLLEFSCSTAIAIIDRLMGGPGKPDSKVRELTDIEQSLVLRTIEKSLYTLTEAWKTILKDLKPKLYSLETNPRFVQIVGPSDTVAVINFELKIGDSQSSMRLCIPYILVEPIIQRMSAQVYYAASREEDTAKENSKQEVKKKIDDIELRVSAILGYTDITVRDLLILQIGDVISLNSLAKDDLPVMVEQDIKYYGKPGLINNKLGIQITNVLSEG